MQQLTLREHVFGFLTAYRARNASPHTLNAYESDLADFLNYCGSSATISSLESRQNLNHYVEWLGSRNLARTSVRRKLAVVRSLSRWAREEGFIREDLAQSIRGPRVRHTMADRPTEREITRLLDGTLLGSTFPERDHAMLELTYGSGLRVAELVGVNVEDFIGRDMLLVRGKGNKERHTMVSGEARAAIAKYLPKRKKILAKCNIESSTLFIGISPRDCGQRLTTRSVGRIFKAIAIAKGLSPTIHPHSLRHAYGQHFYDNGGTLATISRSMGHARLNTTAGTYVEDSMKRMMQEIKKAHPHAKLA